MQLTHLESISKQGQLPLKVDSQFICYQFVHSRFEDSDFVNWPIPLSKRIYKSVGYPWGISPHTSFALGHGYLEITQDIENCDLVL